MSKKVLVIDDAPTVRKYHRTIIAQMGLDTDEAVNGMEALEKILKDNFSLVLVDINMPKMDGYQFLRELRKNEETQHVPAIMITTEADKEDEIQAYKCGANYYLVKPVKPQILQPIVKSILGI